MYKNVKEKSLRIFKHYYSQIYKVKNPRVSKKIPENFFKELEKRGVFFPSVGENFLDSFARFQFSYYLDKDLNHKIKFDWIFGPKAVKRYFNANRTSQMIYKIDQNLSHLKRFPVAVNSVLLEEERNQDLEHCLQKSTLFQKGDKICENCNFSKICSDLKKINYPSLL